MGAIKRTVDKSSQGGDPVLGVVLVAAFQGIGGAMTTSPPIRSGARVSPDRGWRRSSPHRHHVLLLIAFYSGSTLISSHLLYVQGHASQTGFWFPLLPFIVIPSGEDVPDMPVGLQVT